MSKFQWVNDLQDELRDDDYLRDNKFGAIAGGAATGVVGMAGVALAATVTGVAAVAEMGVAAPAAAGASAAGSGLATAAELGFIAALGAGFKKNAAKAAITEAAEIAATVFMIPGLYAGATVERGIRWLFE